MKQCHIFTDDKIGNINPAKGLAERLGSHINMQITHDILKRTVWLDVIPLSLMKLCSFIIPKLLNGNLPEHFFEKENFPEIIIGNGHNAVAFCALLRIYCHAKNYKCFFIQLQNPRISSSYFDMVIPPQHDSVKGKNIYPTIGSLNHITPEKIEHTGISYELLRLPQPVCAVFLGGANKRYKFDIKDAEKCATDLKIFMTQNKCSLAVTASRRTGQKQLEIIKNILGTKNIYIWDGQGENPYFSFLRHAKMAIITADSVNMLSEVATAGLPILLYHLKGSQGKFKSFYSALKKRELAQDFSFSPEAITPTYFNETERIAAQCAVQIKQYFG